MRYDRARSSLDRHAIYIVSAYLAGARRVGGPPRVFPGGGRHQERRCRVSTGNDYARYSIVNANRR